MSPEAPAQIELRDVVVEVPGPPGTSEPVRLLGPLSARLTQRRVAVIGLNGSGKSTLLRVLNGLAEVSSGAVHVHGTDAVHDVRAARRAVGFLFSDPSAQLLMPTPQEDVELSLRSAGQPAHARAEEARRLLEEAGLGPQRHQSVHDLSGGQRQLAALTAVLAVQPQVLVLDEPTTLLDLRHRNALLERLDGLPQQQIIATHDLELAASAERALLIHDGLLLDDGPAEEVIAHYRQLCRSDGFPPSELSGPPSRGNDQGPGS